MQLFQTQSGIKIRAFFQKRWVRTIGYVMMLTYSFFVYVLAKIVLNGTIFRPPNQVFPMTDIVGWLGYIFFLSIISISGVLAIVTAFIMRGVFNILYIMGVLAILLSASYLPLSFIFNADVDFYPAIPNRELLVGKWMDEGINLELFADSTYTLNYETGFLFWRRDIQYIGNWTLARNKIYLSNVNPKWANPWKVISSNGYYFIMYTKIPENPDAWLGYLGLMREEDWLDDN